MNIPFGFDISNEERRKKRFNGKMQTSNKLLNRIKHFFKHIDEDHSLTRGQKNKIKNNIINNL